MQHEWRAWLRGTAPEPWLEAITEQPSFRIELNGSPATWQCVESEAEGDLLRETYACEAAALELSVEVRRVPSHGAFSAAMVLRNEGETPSAPISRIAPLQLDWQAGEEAFYVRTCGGGRNEWFYPPRAFGVATRRALGSSWIGVRSGYDGRSSNEALPLLAVADGPRAVVVAMEWSGIWYLDLFGGQGSHSRLRGGVPVEDLVLEPGEELLLPAAHYVFSEGGLDGASNAFRRYVRDCIQPPLNGERPLPPATYNHWFKLGADIDEQTMLELVEPARRLGAEYFVLDAGWYAGCTEQSFSNGVGNWEIVDEEKFPNGLEPLARAVREAGMMLGLWFEPERAHSDSHWAREHPDWFWDTGAEHLHINLAVPEAREAIVRVISDAIDRLDLRWVKWDYNIHPRFIWEAFDPTGKAMMRHVEGLYRTLDTLVSRHPHVFWECCASGGRRIDLGTLRRAHTAFLSDHAEHAAICRAMLTGASHFLPGTVNSSGLALEPGEETMDIYKGACRLAGLPVFFGPINRWSDQEIQTARELVELHRTYRHLLVQDFYPLTTRPRDEREPDAVQFCAHDGTEAVLMAYSFEAPVDDLQLRPRGLLAETLYRVRRILPADGVEMTSTGANLMESGIPVGLQPESAVFLHLTAEDHAD
ncbi:MAG: alpha-galactosidase [Candidatus Brocadiia bacterium]